MTATPPPPPEPGQYAAQPPGAPNYAGQPAKTWMNITAFVAAFAGFAIPFGHIAAIVFGHLGVRASDRGEAEYRGLGMAGLIMGYIFTVLSIAFWVIYIAFFMFAIAASETYDSGYVVSF